MPDTGFNYRVAVMGEEIEAFKKTEEGKNFWGGRLIWTVLRVLDADSIVTSKSIDVERVGCEAIVN